MAGFRIEARLVAPDELAESLALLRESLRDGVPVSPPFAEQLKRAVEWGDLEVLAVRAGPGTRIVGVISLAFRLNLSAGAPFASIEDLYVRTEMRRRGIGRILTEAVEERCRARGVSYIEVQTDDEAAPYYEALGYVPEPDVRVLSRYLAF
jgi:GNAT superfamily N-acetyltransferase